MRALLLLGIALALAGCGRRDLLRPAVGEAMPEKPAAATVVPTVDDLLTPGPQAQPARSDELFRRSEVRPDDRFDLPPPGR